jgi:hypothetical protein
MLEYLIIFCLAVNLYRVVRVSVIITLTNAIDWKFRGSNHDRANIFSLQKCPDIPWGPPSLIFSGDQSYRVLFFRLRGAEV